MGALPPVALPCPVWTPCCSRQRVNGHGCWHGHARQSRNFASSASPLLSWGHALSCAVKAQTAYRFTPHTFQSHCCNFLTAGRASAVRHCVRHRAVSPLPLLVPLPWPRTLWAPGRVGPQGQMWDAGQPAPAGQSGGNISGQQAEASDVGSVPVVTQWFTSAQYAGQLQQVGLYNTLDNRFQGEVQLQQVGL